MARVFIDVNMFSVDWFKPILKELLSSPRVIFTYGESQTFIREFGRTRKALEFYNLVGNLRSDKGDKRRIDANIQELEKIELDLTRTSCFAESADCDDPHIFALVFSKPTPYIFSTDVRLARCRNHINRFVDNRYCNFIVISSDYIYNSHRQHIRS